MATAKATALFGRQLEFLMSKVPPRELAAEIIAGALESVADVETEFGTIEEGSVHLDHDNVGPLGGQSVQVTCIVNGPRGKRSGIIINVYNGGIQKDEETGEEFVVGGSGTGSASTKRR
jgi:hypothetical protein